MGMPDPLNMASSGKKGKKSKGKTLSLNHFLQDTPGAGPAIPIRKPTTNWADEVEDTYDGYESRLNSKQQNVVLPTAPKAARGLDDYSDKIPQNPPFNVYLSNLPYDVDEDEIADFFSNLKILSMRIPKEEIPGEAPRVRGFGYVEFEDQESLKEALSRPGCTMKGRRIRIEVATNTDNDRRRGGRGRMEMNRDRADRPEVPTGDWRGGRKEPDQPPPPERRYNRDGGGGGGGGFGRDRDGDRDSERSSGAWRDNTNRPAFRERDNDWFRGDRDRDRGEDKPITRDQAPRDRFDDGPGGGGGQRRNFGPRRDDRNGGFNRRDNRDEDGGGGGGGRQDTTRTRPKLNLAPRTVVAATAAPSSTEVAESSDPEKLAVVAPPVAAPSTNPSIFGNAKPVDTTARERQIEERLAKLNSESEAKKDGEQEKRRDERRRSPDRRRHSPRRSPDRKDYSPNRRRGLAEHQRRSPDRRRGSPDGRQSPDKRRGSPERYKAPKRGSSDEKRPGPRADGPPPKEKGGDKKAHRGEHAEREMPKLKTPEPINIVNTNKFAFLEDEEDDD